MKTITKLTLVWICLSSFMFSSSVKQINLKEIPNHNSPILSVFISEKPHQTLQVKIQVDKVFLKSKGLVDKQFKPLSIPLKKYFKAHLKINLNDNQQILHLKSISENKLRVHITYQIKNIAELKNMQVFSDCLAQMEEHDRMPIHVNIGVVNKKYSINNEKTSIKIKF